MRGVASSRSSHSILWRSTRAGRVGGHWVSYFCIELVLFTFFFVTFRWSWVCFTFTCADCVPVNVLYMLVESLHAYMVTVYFRCIWTFPWYTGNLWFVWPIYIDCNVKHCIFQSIINILYSMKPVVTLLGIIEDRWPDFKRESTVH